MSNLNELSKRIFEGNKNKGFWDDRLNVPVKMRDSGLFTDTEIESVEKATVGQLLMLIVSEASEALEADRGRGNTLDRKAFELETAKGEEFKDAFQKYVKDTFEDEIADTIIRLLDLCGAKDIDIDWHIEQKLKYNSTRERLHGKKF
jgi:NTP pyrophosphatase (non-canonical NTP hydrolase)